MLYSIHCLDIYFKCFIRISGNIPQHCGSAVSGSPHNFAGKRGSSCSLFYHAGFSFIAFGTLRRYLYLAPHDNLYSNWANIMF